MATCRNGHEMTPENSYVRSSDGYARCHICSRPVSRAAFVLDHLDPLAHGGEHSTRNVATAHPFCNGSRGAGRIPAQLRLIG